MVNHLIRATGNYATSQSLNGWTCAFRGLQKVELSSPVKVVAIWAIFGPIIHNHNCGHTIWSLLRFVNQKIIFQVLFFFFLLCIVKENAPSSLNFVSQFSEGPGAYKKKQETDWTHTLRIERPGLTTEAPGINILFHPKEWEKCDESCQTWQPQPSPFRQSARCDLMGFSHLLHGELTYKVSYLLNLLDIDLTNNLCFLLSPAAWW